MKTLLVILLVVAVAIPAAADPLVGVYTDASGTGDCNLSETLYSVQSVWVVHMGGVNAKLWQLRVTQTWGGATFVGAFYPILYLVAPDVFGGDTFGAAGCPAPPYAFIRLDFMPLTSTPACGAEIHVVPDPAAASGQIEVVDCNDVVHYAQSPSPYVVINGNETCTCILDPVAAEPSTWGKVKSLYQ